MPTSDPRLVAPVRAIEADRTQDGPSTANTPTDADDGLDGAEVTFSI